MEKKGNHPLKKLLEFYHLTEICGLEIYDFKRLSEDRAVNW